MLRTQPFVSLIVLEITSPFCHSAPLVSMVCRGFKAWLPHFPLLWEASSERKRLWEFVRVFSIDSGSSWRGTAPSGVQQLLTGLTQVGWQRWVTFFHDELFCTNVWFTHTYKSHIFIYTDAFKYRDYANWVITSVLKKDGETVYTSYYY